jgi:hypothetical protein
MRNKNNNHVQKNTQDSLKFLNGKLGRTALATTLVATSVGGLNEVAEAAAVNIADTVTVTHTTTNVKGGTITFTSATDAGNNGVFLATLNASTSFSVVSMVDQDEVHDPVVTIDNGTVSVTTNIGAIAATIADVLTFIVKDDAKLAVAGNITAGQSKTVVVSLEAAGEFIANSADAQTFANTILSTNAKGGILSTSGSGSKTFSGAIGATLELASIAVAGTGLVEFNAAVDSIAATVAAGSTLQLDAASDITTITNSGTLNLNSSLDAISGDGTVVMHTADSILNLNATGALTQDLIVTATVDGHGTINIFDLVDNNLGGVTTTAGGDIGTTGSRVGTLNVGKSDGTKSGILTTIDGDAVFADNINITGGNHAAEDSTINLVENMSATNITLTAGGDADAEIQTDTTAAVIAGDINSNAAAGGAGFTIIDANIGTTISGSVGNLVAVEKLDIAAIVVGANGATLNVGSTLFSGDGTLTFDSTLAQNVSTVMTMTDDEGTIINANTDNEVTINNTIGAEDARAKLIQVNDGSKTTFNAITNSKTFDIKNDSAGLETTFNVGGHIVGDNGVNGGALTIDGGDIVLGDALGAGDTIFNLIEVTAGDGGLEIRGGVVVKPAANFTSGTLTLFDGDGTDALLDDADTAQISVRDNALTNYVGTFGVTDSTITANAKSAKETGAELGVTKNEGTAIHQLMAAAANESALIDTLNDSLSGLNNEALSTTSDLAKQAAPQTDSISGSTVATRAMTGTVQGIVSNRMASLRSGDAYVTGVSAGNGMSANSGFIQAFGSEAEQKNTKTAGATNFGFDSETSGLAIGFDGITDAGSTIGLSASYSTTDVDGKGTGKSKNSIDSYTVSVYGDKSTDAGYVEGSLTYGINDNSNSRVVNVAGLDRIYAGAYDSEQVSLKVGGGIPNEVTDGTFVTPFVNATATLITTDSYLETSSVANDAFRLKVEQDDLNSYIGTVGLKAHMVTDKGTPMISLAVNNEFGDTQINSNNTYQGGGTKFLTSTDVEELSATLGLGYSFGNDVTSLNLNYEANANEDEYMSHYGSVKIVAKF